MATIPPVDDSWPGPACRTHPLGCPQGREPELSAPVVLRVLSQAGHDAAIEAKRSREADPYMAPDDWRAERTSAAHAAIRAR